MRTSLRCACVSLLLVGATDEVGATALLQPPPHAPESVGLERYIARRARAYALLGDGLLIVQSRWSRAAATQAGFDQDPTFFYFTGADHALGAVLVLDGATRRAEVFIALARARATEGMVFGPPPGGVAALAARVDGLHDWAEFSSYVERRLANNPRLVVRVDDGGIEAALAGRLGTPLDSAATLANPQAAWHRALRQRWPNATIMTDTSVSAGLRAVKDPDEIAVLRRVGRNSVAAFRASLSRFAPGRRQREVEATVVERCVRDGDGPSFWPWAMSGPNAAFPRPFSASNDPHHLDRVMQAGEVVRYDIGCKADHYMGDVGRTIPVSGKFTPDQAEVIDLLAAAYRAGLATLREGATWDGLLAASMAEAARKRPTMRTPLGRHAASIMTNPDSVPYWQWHGIGLDLAETLPPLLRAGTVLDYEPIFVVDGQGFYMEDMILITSTGYEILTPGLPNTAAEIERAMRPKHE